MQLIVKVLKRKVWQYWTGFTGAIVWETGECSVFICILNFWIPAFEFIVFVFLFQFQLLFPSLGGLIDQINARKVGLTFFYLTIGLQILLLNALQSEKEWYCSFHVIWFVVAVWV